jgi:hypothetical protein
VPFGMSMQVQTGFGDRQMLADRDDDIGNGFAVRRVVKRVIRGDQRQAETVGDPAEFGEGLLSKPS